MDMKESTAPPSTCFWKIDFNMLKEASKLRKRDPKNFRGAVLTFFAFGGSDDGTIVQKMRAHPAGSLILKERIPLPAGITKPELFRDLPEGSLGRIEEGDPRLLHPTERIKDWVSPTLESIIAANTPAAADSDQD
jgi:hypothetical protein